MVMESIPIILLLAFSARLVNCANETSAAEFSNDVGRPVYASNGNNVCNREETYVEQVRTPSMQPVRVRTSSWCLEFPPRCSNYKTEIREVIKVQNVTKKRTITYCCEGYAGIIASNETVCKPICRGGCGRGYCESPNECSCDAGYTGRHCTQRCRHDRWGEKCKNLCKCRNGSVCDNKSGICHCTTGWDGPLCELPCPPGHFGAMCKQSCECSSNRCNPQTGECLMDDTGGNRNASQSVAKNTTTSVIESLNSTIANITHNLDKIVKNLGSTDTVTLFYPTDTFLEMTTVKTLQELIVIKPENHSPAIIVHQPALIDTSSTTGQKNPEVIHVITNWQQQLKDTNSTATGKGNPAQPVEAGASALVALLILFVFLLLGAIVALIFVYRRYNQNAIQNNPASESAEAAQNKSFPKPLPDLPSFAQILKTKIDGPGFYDSPTNNTAVRGPYSYARKESLYSLPKSRKGSLESHLYDEIRYPSVHHKVSNNI